MIHSFLMIGQSNMAGRGFLQEVAPIHDTGIKMLRNGRWQVMSEPINYDRPFSGIGLAASFAQAWRQDHPDVEIGLIPCADGGSSLSDWEPGSALFDHAVMQAKLAQRSSCIKGILWHQGETDTRIDRIADYSNKFADMIEKLRRELELSNVPVIVGGLGDFLPECTLHDYFQNGPQMNKVLAQLPDNVPDCYFVSATGLTSNPDNLHFCSVSLRIFGLRYYKAYKNNCNILDALPGEEDIVANQNDYVESSLEEKLVIFQKARDEGKITYQEYEYQANMLLNSL